MVMFRYCCLCLARWKNSSLSCPECREPVKSETTVLAIEDMIEDQMGPEKKEEREEKIAERKGRRAW